MCGSSLSLVALVAFKKAVFVAFKKAVFVAFKKAVFVAFKKAGLEDLSQIIFKSWRLYTKEG